MVATLAFMNKIGTHYIASSYEAGGKVFDANNNDLLAAIRFGSCGLVPVDPLLERGAKARKIVSFCNAHGCSFDLRVCWYRKAGRNCSHCEKCYRTMLEICASHGNPNDYGFDANGTTYAEMRAFLKGNHVNAGYWKPIRESFRKERGFWENHPELSWILDFRFNPPRAVLGKAIHVLKKFT